MTNLVISFLMDGVFCQLCEFRQQIEADVVYPQQQQQLSSVLGDPSKFTNQRHPILMQHEKMKWNGQQDTTSTAVSVAKSIVAEQVGKTLRSYSDALYEEMLAVETEPYF